MAKQSSLHSADVNKLEDSINALEAAAEQMAESFTSLENQATCIAEQVPTLQSGMSDGRSTLQTDMKTLNDLKMSIDNFITEIRNKKIGSTRDKQNVYLQDTKDTIENINKCLKAIKSSIEAQNVDYDSQVKAIEIIQNKWVNERSMVDEHNKSLKSLIFAARESLLVATAENIAWEISRTRKALDRRIRWLWGFIGTLVFVAMMWVFSGPVLSSLIVKAFDVNQSNLSNWESLLLGRVSIPIVLSAPYFLLKKSLDSTSKGARLYQHKEVMLKTLIVFRDSLDEEDQTVKDETINKMIEAISIPPSSMVDKKGK